MTDKRKDEMPEEIWAAMRDVYGTWTLFAFKNDRIRHYAVPRTKYIRADLCASQPREVKEVTVEDISQHIEAWKFNDHNVGTFGEYLRGKFPNGLKIKAGGV